VLIAVVEIEQSPEQRIADELAQALVRAEVGDAMLRYAHTRGDVAGALWWMLYRLRADLAMYRLAGAIAAIEILCGDSP
jgi:hypothetical protein